MLAAAARDGGLSHLLARYSPQQLAGKARFVIEEDSKTHRARHEGEGGGAGGGRRGISFHELVGQGDLDAAWPEEIVVVNVYRFHPALLDNPRYRGLQYLGDRIRT